MLAGVSSLRLIVQPNLAQLLKVLSPFHTFPFALKCDSEFEEEAEAEAKSESESRSPIRIKSKSREMFAIDYDEFAHCWRSNAKHFGPNALTLGAGTS
ncbi:hypothetical protein ACLKA7_007491 [Drosophila subpalustris]